MSKFASTKLNQIDLGEGEWVKIPSALSYAIVMKLTAFSDEAEMSKNMLVECIKEWNIKDEDGLIPELNEANILLLDLPTVTAISTEIVQLMKNDQDKKKSVKSNDEGTENETDIVA